jgi:KipI family sensor histidine kinase inhibitor
MNMPTFEPLADDALLVRFGEIIDAAHNARALDAARLLRERNPSWLRDAVPAYASLAVFFDGDRIDTADPHAFVAAQIRETLRNQEAATASSARIIDIPVCYEPEMAPDLAEAASELGIAADDLIRRHSSASYTVAMIGFAPGFPYLLGLPDSLALPRLATPRTRVPAGSVAIGGNQTGIYPRESPGGWRLLGRTPLVLFDATRATPALLTPGDQVRFQRIDAAAFERWSKKT